MILKTSSRLIAILVGLSLILTQAVIPTVWHYCEVTGWHSHWHEDHHHENDCHEDHCDDEPEHPSDPHDPCCAVVKLITQSPSLGYWDFPLQPVVLNLAQEGHRFIFKVSASIPKEANSPPPWVLHILSFVRLQV